MALVSEFCCILGMGIAFWGWGRRRSNIDSNAGRLIAFSLIFRQFEVRSLESAILMMAKESFTILMAAFHEHHHFHLFTQVDRFPPEK